MSLRLLIACPDCRRQYSVAARMAGKRFHCHCGSAVEAQEPQGHDASVVVCSACGAPRQQQASACDHCGSDFTLHEQDLDTVCPGCLARISHKAKFCHHCGLRILTETLAKQSSPHVCPACEGEKHLAHRALGAQKVAVLECQRCAGLWMPIQRLEALIEGDPGAIGGHGRMVADDYKAQAGRMYRPCVVCQQLMVRQNLGRGKSRVIVDVCGHHGVWFDNEELARLLSWVRAGGAQEVRLDLAKFTSSTNKDLRKLAHQLDAPPPDVKSYAAEAWLADYPEHRRYGTVIRGLFSIFDW